MVEPLSERELKILRLIAEGLSNREIGERLFLALDTGKGHNRRLFDKLQVKSRTEAIARPRRPAVRFPLSPETTPQSTPKCLDANTVWRV